MGLAVGVVMTQAEPLVAKEARPPRWSRDVVDAFFDDAREKLTGPRPNYTERADLGNSTQASSLPRAGSAPTLTWSNLITPNTLETEVKRLSQSVASTVTTPSVFKGGGYKDARRDFSELAVLFAVTAQYNGDARWKDAAAGLRDVFSQAAASANVGTDQSYREAVARKQDLADLVRGGRPQVPKADAVVADWSHVAAREPLMQRMNIAHQERLTKWLADAATFRRNRSDVQHEAQIVALLADVIHREAFEYWDDETFAGYATDQRQSAADVAAAAASDNYDQAREAIGRATNACTNCHDGYRG
jgi:cytochrome c556